jgi:hypothetical protein
LRDKSWLHFHQSFHAFFESPGSPKHLHAIGSGGHRQPWIHYFGSKSSFLTLLGISPTRRLSLAMARPSTCGGYCHCLRSWRRSTMWMGSSCQYNSEPHLLNFCQRYIHRYQCLGRIDQVRSPLERRYSPGIGVESVCRRRVPVPYVPLPIVYTYIVHIIFLVKNDDRKSVSQRTGNQKSCRGSGVIGHG